MALDKGIVSDPARFPYALPGGPRGLDGARNSRGGALVTEGLGERPCASAEPTRAATSSAGTRHRHAMDPNLTEPIIIPQEKDAHLIPPVAGPRPDLHRIRKEILYEQMVIDKRRGSDTNRSITLLSREFDHGRLDIS